MPAGAASSEPGAESAAAGAAMRSYMLLIEAPEVFLFGQYEDTKSLCSVSAGSAKRDQAPHSLPERTVQIASLTLTAILVLG